MDSRRGHSVHRPSTQGTQAQRVLHSEARRQSPGERRGTRPPATKSHSTLRVGWSQGPGDCFTRPGGTLGRPGLAGDRAREAGHVGRLREAAAKEGAAGVSE
ncbi:hypothetical protein E2C01_047780 [Portunus trituberculatus]|uniref:Uncharacterized protein n=1 Tax=Portunus trituberculatus TaxID=210409 RepID=A0A5B7G8N6_PORTR|nr:hypothetical protein [Portunus trituberculatus]